MGACGTSRNARARAGMHVLGGLLICLALAPSAHAAEALGGIAGTVTEFGSHAPLAGIEVCAVTTNFELLGEEESEYEHAFGCVKTGTAGEYEVASLRPGSYYVEFFPVPLSKLNYIALLYDGKYELSEATSVAVTAEKTTLDINAELLPGAEITGVVTSAVTGAPINEATVCALRTNTKGPSELVSCGSSEASGAYTIRGLQSGGYKVGFAASGFETAFYNGKISEAEAELVQATAPNLTPGIDGALKPGITPTAPPGSASGESSSGAKLSGGLGASSSPSPKSTLSLAGRHIPVAHDGDALVKVDCAGTESCRAKLTLRVKMAIHVKGKRMLRTVTIGTSAILSIFHGKTALAQIKLDPEGLRLLRDHERLHVDLVLVAPGRKQDDSVVLVERRTRSKK
jgi:Carboxypeptidase regulatory-like domain